MRNIYDIIAEQKALVDVEICSYELKYLAEEFDCLQEGFGETVKNILTKVVEFINTIIRKIKELVSKVVNFFRSKKKKSSSKAEAEADLKAAKKKGAKDSSSEHADLAEKANKVKEEKKKELSEEERKKLDEDAERVQKKADEEKAKEDERRANLEKQQKEHAEKLEKEKQNKKESLETSNVKVKIPHYASLEEKKKLTEKFFNKLSALVRIHMNLDEKDAGVDNSFLREIYDTTFTGNGSMSKDPKAKLPERIKMELGETGEEQEFVVKDLASKIAAYNDYGMVASYIQSMGNEAIDELEKLKNRFTQLANSGSKSAEAKAKNVNVMVNIVNMFVNTMCTSVVKAYQTYSQISTKIQDGTYKENSDNKEDKEEGEQ